MVGLYDRTVINNEIEGCFTGNAHFQCKDYFLTYK